MAINFNTEPYNDDYDAAKDFYRILFRPGYPVQARELTQLQTILQQQVSRFGDHVFKNGSQVIPGSVNYDHRVHFLKLETTYNTLNVQSYLTQFRDKIITGVTSGVKFKVIDTSACGCVVDQLDIPTLYCKVEQTASDGTTSRFIPGESIVALEADNQIDVNPDLTEDQIGDLYATIRIYGDDGNASTTYTENEVSDVIGYAFQIDVKEGIYYIDGFFVRNPELHLYVGRFNSRPTGRVGFKVVETLVTADEDETLLDNAQGSYNYAAPGADRYKISVELVKLPLQSTDSVRFVELIRVSNGVIQHKIEKATYSELEKTLARRTYDESGNYEVNKFRLSAREHLDNGSNGGVYPPVPGTGALEGNKYGDEDKFVLVVDPGKAYIQGYEVESTSTQYVEVNKAREIVVNNVVNEGGHIVRLEDQPIGLANGNWVMVNNVYKFPDLTAYSQVYITNRLNTTPGAAPTASTIIGTARVKFIQLHSSDYSGGTATQYKLGLFDVNINNGFSFEKDAKQIVGTATSDNFSCDISPTLLSLEGSATTSNSSATVTGVGTEFSNRLVAGDVLFVNGVRVGRVSATPTNNLSLTLDANAASTINGGSVAVFRATIQEPEHDTLLFRVGPQFVKTLRGYDSLTQTDTLRSSQFTVRRTFTDTASGAGVFDYELTNSKEFFLSDDDLSNYTLIDNVTKLPVAITTSSITFDNNTTRKVVYISGLTASRSYTLICSVLQIETAAREKTKALITNYAGDTITTKKALTSSTIELTKAMGYKLRNVYMTPGDYATFNQSNSIDITDRFTLDDGQRPTYYTNSKLLLKPGYQVPSGAIKVVYDYFAVSETGNYFSVDSYTNVDYADIPNYYVYDHTTGSRQEICLACVVDFRPVIAGTNTWYPELPKKGSDGNTPIAHYVGRIDKVVLDSVGRFNILAGVPSLKPEEPEDPREGLVLGTVIVPPYTKLIDQVRINQRDNRRYTMKDIGKLDRRISNLEYYVTLNLLEKDTETMQIKDSITGLDKFKNGFIVDQFTGHGVGDVKHEDYKVAIDSEKRILRSMHFTTALDLVEELDSGAARASANYAKTNDVITLPYTEQLFVFNPNASRTIDVNPYKIGAFRGQVYLIPEGDNWKDTDRRPDLNVVDDNNYDAIRFMAEELGVTGAKWNEWQTNWTGSESSTRTYQQWSGWILNGYSETTTVDTGYRDREGINTTLNSSVNAVDYGDRVVDVGFTPYMRARPVAFITKNLKPDTIFYPFFDSVRISEYVKPADMFTVTRAVGSTITSFNMEDLQNNILADDPARAYDGKLEPSFNYGDIVKNSAHTAVNITTITNLTSAAATFNLTVSSATGISPGHHVYLYNLDYHNAISINTLYDSLNVPASVGLSNNTSTSKQLNLKKFKVTAVSGTTITLANIDGTNVSAFSAYSTASYTSGNFGKLLRLQASGVVTYGGEIAALDGNGYPTTQNVHVVNIRNGFAIGETITGSTNIGETANKNSVVINAINGGTSTTTAPTLKALGDDIRTDANGDCVGVFFIPNTDAARFRTGERAFKLIDNISNTDAVFDSMATVNYYSQGVTLSKERTIVSSRTAEFVQDRLYEAIPVRRTSVSTRLLYSIDNTPRVGHDPLAQTFTVSSEGGAFVTSVDLYFSEATNRSRPVIVELRNTNNGVPSTKILPFSTVIKASSEINTSIDGSAATTFKFAAPIYLQDGETYALVVKTDQPGLKIFVSELGQTDLITNNVIGAQPLTGSLYLSQNSIEFEINPLLDMKFNLRKAEFDTSVVSNVTFRTSPLSTYTLPLNPFEITPGTNKIRVFAPNHGFIAGETVVISGVADGNYGTSSSATGIPATLFNRAHTVFGSGIDKDSFIIDLVTTANSTSLLVGSITNANFVKGEYGGGSVVCTRGAFADALFLKTSDMNFQDTSLIYSVDTEDESGVFSGFQPIVANSNYFFPTRRHIRSYENQLVLSSNPLVKKSSVRFNAKLKSDNPNVSPVIDMQKLSTYVISNHINDVQQDDVNIPEIDTRTIIAYGDITNADIRANGTSTITTATNSTAVTGSSTVFTTQVVAGNKLYTTGGTLIGTVSSVTNNTAIVLTGNAAVALTNQAFVVQSNPTLRFENSVGYSPASGLGIISSVIDSADNLLDNIAVGKYIKINNIDAGITGNYLVNRVETTTDSTTFAGNVEADITKIYVTPPFNISGALSVDMTTDTDFSIVQLDKFVDDFAPVGATNMANYITRKLSLQTPADSIKVMFDACILSRTDIKVYYRGWDGDIDLKKVNWVDTGFVNDSYQVDRTFAERTIDVEGIKSFSNLSIKIVLKSSDPAQVPTVKNLRVIAYS